MDATVVPSSPTGFWLPVLKLTVSVVAVLVAKKQI